MTRAIRALVPDGVIARCFASAVWVLAALALLSQQEARLGSWRVALPAAAWLGVLLALALPSPTRPLRFAAVAWPVGVLAAAAVPLFIWRDRVARPPVALMATVRSSEPEGASAQTPVADFAELGGPGWRLLLGLKNHFDLAFDAVLDAPETGLYRFDLEADDAAALEVDGTPVIGWSALASATIPLTEGLHEVGIRYRQDVGPARLALAWNRPAFLEATPFVQHLADREGLEAFRARRRPILLSLWCGLAWSAAAALLLARAGESWRTWRFRPTGVALRERWGRVRHHPYLGQCALVFAGAALLLFSLERAARPYATRGFYFHAWESEYLMQTVSVADLRDEPFRSLFYLHIQPPLFDTLRALLARLYAHASDGALLRGVDGGLYVLWGLSYAALAALVCLWLARLTTPRYGLLLAAAFALHPAAIGYATVLDTTMLSATIVCWMYYELWRWYEGRGSEGRFLAALLLLFFLRSAFQWPFLVVAAAALLVMGAPKRKVLRMTGVAALVMAAYIGKQYALFGLTFTSSFAADSFCKGLGRHCHVEDTVVPDVPGLPPASAASVLSRPEKLGGYYNYNQLPALRDDFAQMAEYKRLLREMPASEILEVWGRSLRIYFLPSSDYDRNAVLERLPWRRAYDRVASGAPLVVLLAAAAAMSLARAGPRRNARLGLALPGLYVFAVTVIFEQGENNRYKFFLEPVLFVWIAAQGHALARALRARMAAPAREASP
jgi:PA14 domain-containing protein